MDHDSQFPRYTTYTYNKYVPLTAMVDATGGTEQTGDRPDPILPPPPSSSFALAHDPEKRVFLLTGPDGKTEVFRDNPTRYLSVAPDHQTGEMKPVMKYGKPTYLWLCREEREVH
jgi:hypothetical protein